MVLAKTTLKGALRLDFTGSVAGFHQLDSFSDQVVSLIRNNSGPKVLIVIDRGFGLPKSSPHLVADHLNLTGGNPLTGPNDPCGERFPSVNDIYVTDVPVGLPTGIAAGLRNGLVPSDEALKLIRSLGADFYCYNLVPTMIVAAHARYRVLGILVPEGEKLDSTILSVLESGGGN